jgi:hypothetical protein
VAPLTILLWVYAEREQLVTKEDVHVRIKALAGNPAERIVTVLSDDRDVSLDLSGPRATLGIVRDQLAQGKAELEVLVSEDPGAEYVIPLVDRLSRNDIFAQNAVRVTKVRPAWIKVKVEARTSRRLRVKAKQSIIGKVVFEPAEVTVWGPKSLLESPAIPAEQMVAEADMSKFANRTPGHYEENVPVAFPYRNENITLAENVRAKVDIEKTEQVQLDPVRVLVEIPAGLLEADRQKVQTPVTLANVLVTGSEESIRLLKEGKFVPAVVVELKPEDFATQGGKVERTKRLALENYRMPKDVTVTNPERDITVTITDRG